MKKKCPYCNAVQSYSRYDEGIKICIECKKELPIEEKKPSCFYTPMTEHGHSRKMRD